MYEAFFGFRQLPFASAPRADRYFPAKAIESARKTLIRCIQRSEGTGLVVGPAGTGKTLLVQLLADQLRDQFAVALLSSGGLCNRRGLLQAILFGLGRPYRGMDEADLRLSLIDYLSGNEFSAQAAVLLVDEAHTLPLRLLEEIRLISNLVVGGQPRIRLVLAGAPMLEERLASPKLESFSQRLAARCYLEAFGRTETDAYIRWWIETVGGQAEEILAPDACEAVHQATGGIARLVNQVCDHALLLAYTAGRRQIGAECIREAWADLQQLPAPCTDPSRHQSASSAIEFGTLEDEPPECPAAHFTVAPGAESASGLEGDVAEVCASGGYEGQAPSAVERLEQIEQALHAIDDDFQPAGSIGPEIEIVFDEPNPFSEQFEEEEVIVDRYAPIGSRSVPVSAGAPGESQALHAPRPQRVFFSENVFCTPLPDLSGVLTNVVTSDVAVGEDACGAQSAAGERESPSAQTVPSRRHRPPAEPDDSDMILLEDGYEDLSPPHVRPVGRVRKQEYRQLFARLRRG